MIPLAKHVNYWVTLWMYTVPDIIYQWGIFTTVVLSLYIQLQESDAPEAPEKLTCGKQKFFTTQYFN